MSKVLLVWSTLEQHAVRTEDHWSAHDSLEEAQEAFLRLIELRTLVSASICGVIQSTDYSAMPEFYLG